MKTNNCFTPAVLARPATAIHHSVKRRCARAMAGVLVLASVIAARTPAAFAQDQAPAPGRFTEPGAATNSPVAEPQSPPPAADSLPAMTANTAGNTNGLNLNFRNAPIDLVLEHLVKAAGFVIVMDAPARGTITVIGQGLTKEEAVDLLNTELNKNNLAAIRTGRTLRIMTKEAVKSSNNPVKVGNAPEDIPNNDEVATWIIPIRFVEASQLVSDLSPFVSSQATIIANQAGNSIVITDVQANIRHLCEIIKSIDSSAEDVTEVRVFHLDHADPTEMANLLTGLFQDQSGNATTPFQFGGRGGRGGGFGGGGGGRGGGFGGFGGGGFGGGFNPFAAALGGQNAGGNSQQSRIKKRNQVVAVADPRTSSIVVTATKDLIDQIADMIKELDHQGKQQRMEVIRINNADPSEVLQVLQDTVGASTSRNTRNTQSDLENRRTQNQNNNSSGTSAFGNGIGNTGRRN